MQKLLLAIVSSFVFLSLFGLMGPDLGAGLTGIFKAILIAFIACPLMTHLFVGDLTCVQVEVTTVTGKLGMLDEECLRR